MDGNTGRKHGVQQASADGGPTEKDFSWTVESLNLGVLGGKQKTERSLSQPNNT
jgi:hypothetical protein